MNHCPCCSYVLSRHVRGRDIYWFCRHCWQEMPLLDNEKENWITSVTKLESSRVILSKPQLAAT